MINPKMKSKPTRKGLKRAYGLILELFVSDLLAIQWRLDALIQEIEFNKIFDLTEGRCKDE